MGNKVLKTIAGSSKTTLKLGNVELECYVLEDSTRVFSGNGLQKALEFPKNAGGTALNKMLETDGLSSILTTEITDKFKNRKEFVRPGAGGKLSKTYGYDVTLLIDIWDLLIEGRNRELLTPKQAEYAKVAEIIIRSTAKVGITALVDEVTGYQEIRDKDALKSILDKFLKKEFSAWAKRFPDEFYKEIFRLRGWKYSPTKRPGVIGKWTNDLIYERLAPGILDELQARNPITEKGTRKQKHHQWLSEDIGHPALNQHMHAVLGLMRASNNWDDFYALIQRAYPKKNENYQYQLTLKID